MGWTNFVADVFKRPASYRARLILSLLFITITTAVVMTVFQTAKAVLIPGLNLWEAQIITIIFVSLLSPVIALFVLLKFEDLYRKANVELQERKRAAEALQKSEARLVRAQAIAHIGNWEWDLRKGEGRWSDELYYIFGEDKNSFYPSQENFLSRVHPEDRSRVESSINATYRDGKPYILNFRIIRPDGSERTLYCEGELAYDKDGKLLKMFGINQDITERMLAEEALRESEDKYRAVVENQTEMITRFTPDYVLTFVNEAVLRYTGRKQEEVVGYNILEFLPPDQQEKFKANVAILSKDNLRAAIENCVVMPDGEVRWQQWINTAILDDNGHLKEVQSVGQDITERRRAEEALRRSEERFRALILNSSDIIRILDQGGRIIFDSPSSERILGYPAGALLGMSAFDYIHPDDRERCRKDLVMVYDHTNTGVPTEFRTRKANGDYLEVESVGMNLFGVPGVDGIVVTTRPITERKRAEEERERLLKEVDEQRARLQAILDSLPVGVWVADVSEKFVMANDAAAIIWGGKAPLTNKVDGYDAYKFWWPDTNDRVPLEDYPVIRALRGEKVKSMIVDFERFDGTRGTQLTSSTPIRDLRGTIVGGVVAALDITMLKRTEEELNAAKQLAELYIDLMGHDINNMHQIALGYLEIAEGMMAYGDSRREYIEKPMEVLQRSAQLIKSVRKLQKLNEGVFQTLDVDICEVLRDLQREFGVVPHKKIMLSLNGHDHCLVRANELLHDVFANLVSNAIKHTGDRADIGIDLDVVTENGIRFWRVSVEDNGPGIPDDFKSRIFHRMLKGTNSAKGMGLGLYLVKSLVDSYGGRVWVEDRVKGDHTKGAQFVVMLPAVEE